MNTVEQTLDLLNLVQRHDSETPDTESEPSIRISPASLLASLAKNNFDLTTTILDVACGD